MGGAEMGMPLDQEAGRAFEVLDEEECLNLLDKGWLGRVVITIGAIPAVFPVNYCVESGAIYFLTGSGTKLAAALRSAVVTFQVDEVDPVYHHGWSVMAVGAATVVHEESVRRAVGHRLYPWAPGRRRHLVQIWPDMVTGRRIAFGLPEGADGHAAPPVSRDEALPGWYYLAPLYAATLRHRTGGPR